MHSLEFETNIRITNKAIAILKIDFKLIKLHIRE